MGTRGGRVHTLHGNLGAFCEAPGVAYLSPHKFRHGHVMHALTHARTPADWKAISQNVMHSGLGTTDEIYGTLKDDDIASRSAQMGGSASAEAGVLSRGGDPGADSGNAGSTTAVRRRE